jgi:hypothetical protein
MAKKNKTSSAGRSRPRSDKKKHRFSKPKIHVLPALLEAGGILLPTYYGPNPPISDYVGSKISGQSTVPFGDYVTNSAGNVKSDLPLMIEMVIGGIVLKWVGKKTGLNKYGTKEMKIL